jgi:Major tropism determinant N-terminal domain
MAAQTRIQFRRGTASEWTSINPILYAGEMGYETDTKKIKVGDGTTFWSSLAYATIKPDDLNELVDDRINDLLIAGSNIQKTYNDGSNTLTLAVTGVSLVGHSHSSSDITNFNSSVSGLLPVKSIIAGSNINVTPTGDAGFIISTNGVDSNTVKDIVGASVTGGTGIFVSYNNTSKVTSINATGVSFNGHSHVWSNITDASSKATLNELAYLSGVSPGSVSASRAVVVDSNKNLTGLGDVSTTGTLTVGGNLVVNGTTVTVNSTTVDIGDNILRVNTSGLSTGGLEVVKPDSSTVSLLWNNTSNRWEFTGGNISTNNLFVGNLSGNASTVTNGVYTTDTGTVTSSMIANNTIVDGDISDSANIAITKLASSGLTLGSTTVNLGQTSTILNGLSSISGTSLSSPTTLYNCIVDGGTP